MIRAFEVMYWPTPVNGVPYIGRTRSYKNAVVATGHAMLGLSLGAGTGKLMNEHQMDLKAFAVNRFG